MSSVELRHIKRFVSLTKKANKHKIINALEQLQKDIRNRILTRKSPWAAELEEIQDTYLAILNGKAPYKVSLNPQRLSHYVKLASSKQLTQSVQGLGSLPAAVPGGVISASNLMRYQYPTYEFHGNWGALFGQPQTNAKLMIWGEPGQGKSTLGYQFARYLASSFGKVLYVASEEINPAGQASMTVQTKLKSVGGPVDGWEFTGSLAKINGSHKFVFIDSVNDAGLTQEQFEGLTQKFPQICFVLIFQATKEGKFKGEKDWEHLVDIVATVKAGEVTTTKNRFAALATVRIF